MDAKATAFSTPLTALKPGVYKIAGILDSDSQTRGTLNNGNYFSAAEARLEIHPDHQGSADLYLAKTFERQFSETENLKAVELKSDLLSAFHKKPVFIQAAIVLPEGYKADSSHRYPVVYAIPGWGGTHYDAQNPGRRARYGMTEGTPKIYVYLNPETQTPYGLHAFVDSRVNGPWGKALVEELLPYIRKNYKAALSAGQTFVIGQSSGGYAALWLPLHYPQAFGGSWAVSPDPVDFRNFVGVNLYEWRGNFYESAGGTERPFFLLKGKPMSTLRQTVQLETFEGDGGQFQSFEAAFGKPDALGRPRQIFNRKTGMLDPEVVRDWEPYDLSKYVRANWKKLQPWLGDQKLHVYAGENDNFFLNQSVVGFQQQAEAAGADIVVEVLPEADHFSIWSPAFTSRVQREIDAQIEAAEKQAEK